MFSKYVLRHSKKAYSDFVTTIEAICRSGHRGTSALNWLMYRRSSCRVQPQCSVPCGRYWGGAMDQDGIRGGRQFARVPGVYEGGPRLHSGSVDLDSHGPWRRAHASRNAINSAESPQTIYRLSQHCQTIHSNCHVAPCDDPRSRCRYWRRVPGPISCYPVTATLVLDVPQIPGPAFPCGENAIPWRLQQGVFMRATPTSGLTLSLFEGNLKLKIEARPSRSFLSYVPGR